MPAYPTARRSVGYFAADTEAGCEKAYAIVSPPIRPKNMNAMSSSFERILSDGVMPVLSPTVARADAHSNMALSAGTSSYTQMKSDPMAHSDT